MGKCKCGYFFSGSYCPVCETPPEKKKPKRIAHNSKKRVEENREYSQKRKEFLEENPICQVHNCGQKSDQVHHKKGRTGKLLTNKKYFLAVCGLCHDYIENNPLWAKAQGYSESRLK